jgi:hypothetical protein
MAVIFFRMKATVKTPMTTWQSVKEKCKNGSKLETKEATP